MMEYTFYLFGSYYKVNANTYNSACCRFRESFGHKALAAATLTAVTRPRHLIGA